MDTLTFRVVRPMNRLTQLALYKHFNRPSEQLSLFNSKLIQRYALLDYVDHRTMLMLLIDKAKQAHGSPSFSSLRQVLHAVHKFPYNFKEEKREFESALLASVLAAPSDALSSVEFGALWSLTTELTDWGDVLRLSRTFPMQSTLHHQSEDEFRIVLDQMVAATGFQPFSVASPASAITEPCGAGELPRGARLLLDLVGGETAMRRAVDGIMKCGNCWMKQGSAVSTFLGIVHTLGTWPTDKIADKEAWQKLALQPSTLHNTDLSSLLRAIARVHSLIVPAYVREALMEALSADLWLCYSAQPNEPLAMSLKDSRLWDAYPALNSLSKEGKDSPMTDASNDAAVGGDGTPEIRIPAAVEAFRKLHVSTLEKQFESDGPPLTLNTLINVLLSSACLGEHGELMGAVLTALKDFLTSSTSSVASSRGLSPLQASVIAMSLDRIKEMASASAAQSSSCIRSADDILAIEKLIVPVLRYTNMRERGSARCVIRLLCDCHRWTKQWGLEEECVKLLGEHVSDGFTRAQLQGLLEREATGLLQLPVDIKEAILRSSEELPSR
ncbi:hypothetical protein ERJ75_001600600 [Trypanosoma vivax]|uniref:Uncharacterized protein n=1 Tax=Trypanosoma vivax (strain Y486) TaxID=1055687 RepID=G0TSL8_TRYVY|nr:hypothetical protein TRVL_01221 [Trypanosoma vivax]KAH8605698.1 hypothetical protein ERJ75_001600600 [Trypanosoma vivax]CCC46945.1 conserved hypothetical protein [Trypanosoma vivax Y486]